MQMTQVVADRAAALDIRGLSKAFGQTRALDDVSFQVRSGHVHGLLGGNGSGKSTLIKVLAGVHQGDPGGRIVLGGEEVRSDHVTPELARRLGMRFVHQNPAVVPSMTVAENVALGARFPTRAGRIRWRALHAHTQRLLDRFDIAARADDRVGDLRQAEQTMIAIARALQDSDESAVSTLVLDEPTASLPDHEVRVLLEAIRRFARMGHTILYVSHRLDEILEITDHVTVLRDGRHVETRATEGLAEPDLIRMIVGHGLDRRCAASAPPAVARATPLLEVSGLAGGPLRDVSLEVRPGEITGLAGLLGAGRTELLRMIFGDLAPEAGTIKLGGQPVTFREPREAMAAGVALVPEDRNREGVFQGLSVMENLTIGQFEAFASAGRIDKRREREAARRSVVTYRVKAADELAPIGSLSGGNQQKVVMGRWLRRKPRLLLLDEPTQGVDVGAREDLYAAIRACLEEDMAVLVASSDFDELAQICNRVLVLKGGRITTELRGDRITRQNMTEEVLVSEGEEAQ